MEGLTSQEAQKLLEEHGYNEIAQASKTGSLTLFLSQFKDIMILILLVALFVSAAMGELIDACAIGAIVLLNGFLGFFQQYKAERAVEALREMASPKAIVVRDNEIKEIDSREVVPGDLTLVDTGDRIPADIKILESMNLMIDESSLTGESVPVTKDPGFISGEDTPLAERKNFLFMGTTASNGYGRGKVTATGKNTEFGKIAELVRSEKEGPTPLQKKLDELGKRLGVLILSIAVIMFIVGLLQGNELLSMFMLAVALAVAAIPEGLPAVVTITLAIGIKRIAKKKGIVKKLKTVETLGSATVICTDKTGTLTKNEMTVTDVFTGKEIKVGGVGYESTGNFSLEDENINPPDDERLKLLLTAAVLCNNSDIILDENGRRKVKGDPTEGALLVLGEKARLGRLDYKKINELSFDSERKMMSVVCSSQENFVFTKGAPESVLDVCTSEYGKDLTPERKKELLAINERYASSGLRVLAVAYKIWDESEEIEEKLDFLGLVGMIDPPREEAKQAIKSCNTAGIKVVMVTGDHLLTAKAIGTQLGLVDEGSIVMSGVELDRMGDDELNEKVENISIFARVSAEHKMKIIKALKERGHVVAMTGDGINDAPSLKSADIGISMGITGTDVAKEASDMVLTDDNFATIVNAVEEGRGIFNNIKKTTHYLLSCNVSEVLIIAISMFALGGSILIPIQILWMNLVTDGLPAIALGVDPLPDGLMRKKPRNQKESILDRKMLISIFLIGVVLTIAVLVPCYLGHLKEVAFTLVIMLQLIVALSIREEHIGKVKNKILGIAVLGSAILQFAVIFTPMNVIFETRGLEPFELGAIAAICFVVFCVLEGRKHLKMNKPPNGELRWL